MNYPLISEYIESIRYAEENFATLTNLRPVLDDDGSPVMSSGNFAVVFKMRDEQDGKLYALKCFIKDQEGRDDAYRKIADELEYVSSTFLTHIQYFDKELFVVSNNSVETEFPVLMMDWVEGITLDKYIRKHIDDQYKLSLLAYQFSKLVMWLMPQPFAHGDLKPDNILVHNDGSMVLVDYDGMFVPAMKGQKARELGSPDFRHPSRTENDFDEHIDDFSIVSILLSLKAIALQPALLDEYGASDRLLFSVNDYLNISRSGIMAEIWHLIQDIELNTLMSLFMLSVSQKNLSSVSYRLLSLSRPNKLIDFEAVRGYCSIQIEDLSGFIVDQYGAIYSKDNKILLRLPYEVIEYNVKEGTEIIANNAFDHFDVIADSESCDICYAYLENIFLPSTVKYITDLAFGEDGHNLREIRVANNLNYYKSILPNFSSIIIERKPYNSILTKSESIYDLAGAEYSSDGKELISFRSLSPDILSYRAKDGVERLQFGLAQLSKNIHEIIIPYGVECIPGAAFRCSSLTSIILPKSLKKIERDAFESCDELQTIEIPEGVEAIEYSAFFSCQKLELISLPSTLLILSRSFAYCKNLKIVRFKGRTEVHKECFSNCLSLQTIFIPKGSRALYETMLPDLKDLMVEE